MFKKVKKYILRYTRYTSSVYAVPTSGAEGGGGGAMLWRQRRVRTLQGQCRRRHHVSALMGNSCQLVELARVNSLSTS